MAEEDVKQAIEALAAEMRRGFENVNGQFGEVRGEIADVREEMRTEFANVRGEIANVRQEMRTEFTSVRGEVAELRGEITDVRRHMDVVAEGLRSDIKQVAEAALLTDERVYRIAADIRELIHEETSAIRTLVVHSYKELDRRVTALEDAASNRDPQ